MTITELQQFRAANLYQIDDSAKALPQIRYPDAPGTERFRNAFEFALDQVDMAQKTADQQIESFIAGEQENLHEVMIQMNQAKTSFQLLVEVRNKMMEAYQELFRMQI